MRGHLLPGKSHRALDDEFGDIRQTVAHLHQRQPTREVGHRDAKQRDALEMTQHLDLPLGVIFQQLLQRQLQIPLQALASRQLGEQPLIEQLIQQQRMGCDLIRQELTARAQLDQPGSRHSAFLQQREIHRRCPMASTTLSTRRSTVS